MAERSVPTIGFVASDRLSATDRADLREAPVPSFRNHVAKIKSMPILTCTIPFESSLKDLLPWDGVRFDEPSTASEYGSLGWIVRDSTKPSRERKDSCECWVIQSGPLAAQRVLENVSSRDKSFLKIHEN